MGLSTHIINFLLERHKTGVNFSQTATVGRQEFHVYREEVAALMRKSHLHAFEGLATSAFDNDPPYAEPFFSALGAEVTRSFDHSDFEGATDLHNFNDPIPQQYHGRFSVVFDGGSLEHIFNFPEAVRNCMLMVQEGGHFLGSSYANNLTGHGFYQFSPELMFRVFGEANGFDETEVFLVEQTGNGTVWKASDPAHYGRRVELTNARPTFMFVSSRRLRLCGPFASWPAQSDYAERWQEHEVGAGKSAAGLSGKGNPASKLIKHCLKSVLPVPLAEALREWRKERQRRTSLRRPFAAECYREQQR